MADPVILNLPLTTGESVTLDTSGFDSKLAETDNLVQELADAFDDHTHTMAELTAFSPPDDNASDLGAVDARWKDIYAGNAVIQTSDKRLKVDVSPMGDHWEFLSALSAVSFRFKDGKRFHTGFLAQDVQAGLKGLKKDYAMFCQAPNNGLCGLRYEEAIAPLTACVHDLKALRNSDKLDMTRIKEEAKRDHETVHSGVQYVAEELEKVSQTVDTLRGEAEDLAALLGKRFGAVELRLEVLEKIAQAAPALVDSPMPPPPSKTPLILGALGCVMGLAALVISLL